jgi:hypothetical protein
MEVVVLKTCGNSVSMLTVMLALSGCSVGNSADNNMSDTQVAPAPEANSITAEKVALAEPANVVSSSGFGAGTKCFARKDDRGAGGVRLAVQSSGTVSGVYYAMSVNAADGAYVGSFGEAQGKLTGNTLSISLDPKGGTSTDLRKSDEIWTLSDKGFSNGTGLYAPADCAIITAEYEKRSSEE